MLAGAYFAFPCDLGWGMMARKPGETWQIYQVSATGGETRLMLADQRNLADPDWSPDGQQIVFGREADLMGKENGPTTLNFSIWRPTGPGRCPVRSFL